MTAAVRRARVSSQSAKAAGIIRSQRSWGVAKEGGGEEQGERGDRQPREKFGGEQVALGLEFDFLRAVDGLEGGLGGVGVEGAEEFAAGEFGDFAQGGFVEVRHHAPVADFVACVVEDRERHDAVFAGTDSVDGDVA